MRALLSRLGGILFRRSSEDRLALEIDHHLEMLTEEMMANGMPAHEARLAARKQFGNIDRTRMLHRDQRGLAWLETLAQDIRFAVRILTRERGFMMARSMHRSPEIAIRTSLGASRLRIVRQLLVEATVLAAAAALIGALFSIGGVALFQSAIPPGTLPYWFDYSMDASVFAALVIVAITTITIFGLVPAMQASRTDVNRTLKAGGRAATGNRRAGAWTAGFLTIELALAMIMLTQVAVATVRSNADLPTDAAIETTAVLTAAVTLPVTGYPTPERRNDFFRRLNERLDARNEISAVSRVTLLPGDGGPLGLRRVDVEGGATAQGSEARTFQVIEIAPSYLDTMALPLAAGRDFSATDGSVGNDAALVNERFVELALSGAEPIGARIGIAAPNAPRDAPSQWRTIIGVIPPFDSKAPAVWNNGRQWSISRFPPLHRRRQT